jgi:phosphohistidine phosphatase
MVASKPIARLAAPARCRYAGAMPRLLLLRHAKAERARPGVSDHERSLSERGRDDAAAVGSAMAARGERPDAVICSPSQRTRQTWDEVRPNLEGGPEPRFARELYEGGDYLAILRREGGNAQSLLLIGHNPTTHDTATLLAADLTTSDGALLKQRFPTAALAILDFDGGWADLRPGAARLAAFIRPRDGQGD